MKTFSRREALASCLGGVGALALAARTASAWRGGQEANGAQAPSSRFGGIQIGCMTWSFREQPISAALNNIVKIGFSSVELWSGHLDPFKSSDSEIVSWRKRFADAGVKITSYFVTFDEKASDAQINRNFQAGRLLGVSVLSSNVAKSLLPRISEACRKHRMYVGLHNEVYGRPMPNQVQFPSDYAAVFRKYPRWIGATLDVGHLYAAGYDPVQFIRKYQARIVSIHLKDENRVLPHYTDFPFGKGPTPLVPILHTLQQIHFKYPANIEWGVQGMNPVAGVAAALAYVKRALTA